MTKVHTFILAGVPRAGKSYFRNKILQKYRIPGLTTDLLRDGLATGVPDLGLKEDQSDREKAEILWPLWRSILQQRAFYHDKLLIEGVNFLPKYLAEVKDKDYLRICFVGYPRLSPEDKLKQIKKYTSSDCDWHEELTDDQLLNLIRIWIEDSLYFEQECNKYDLEFVDLSNNFKAGWERVEKFLFAA